MYVERTSEKLRQIIRSYKIRPTFYTESTMHKLICKPNDRVVTEDKTILFMKLILSTVPNSTLVNLNGL